jgi:hypothetical protein
MTIRPVTGYFATVGRLFGEAKAAQDALSAVVGELLGSDDPATMQIGAGDDALQAPAKPVVYVTIRDGATYQNLDRVAVPNGSPRLLVLFGTDAAKIVIIRSDIGGDGQIRLLTGPGSVLRLQSPFAYLMLMHQGDNTWLEIARSYGRDTRGTYDAGASAWAWGQDGVLRHWGQLLTDLSSPTTVTFGKPYADSSWRFTGMVVISGAEPTVLRVACPFGRTSSGFLVKVLRETNAQIAATIHWSTAGYTE